MLQKSKNCELYLEKSCKDKKKEGLPKEAHETVSNIYSFTPPSATPAIMNFERKRYAMMIGTIATVIIM